MKNLLIAALAAASFAAMAQNAAQPAPARPKPGIRPNRGLTPPGLRTNANFRITFPEVTGPHVLFVSASEKAGTNTLNKARDAIMMMLRMPIRTEVRQFDGCAVEFAEKVLKEADVAAVVVVKDDPRAPSLVSLPEKRIAILNPLAYCPEGTAAALAEARVVKMLQRGYCAVMGATLAPVFSAEDLDALHGGIAPSALNSVFRYGKVLGMERMTPIELDKDGRPVESGKAPATPATPSAPAIPAASPMAK